MRWWAVTACLFLVLLARPAAAAGPDAAVVLDPARSYPLTAIARVQRDGGPWFAPGTFVPSRTASSFHRRHIVFRLSILGARDIPWVIRALPQIDSIDLVMPDGTREHTGMAVPVAARPIAYGKPELRVPPALLDGRPFEVWMDTTTEVRIPLLMTAAAAQNEDDGTRSVTFLFIGFYLAVALVFSLLYLSLRDRQMLLYALVMLTLVNFEATNKVYAWEYLWPHASLEWHLPNAFAFEAYYAALVAFCSSYLRANGRLVWFRRGALALLALNIPAGYATAVVHDFPGVANIDELLTAILLFEMLVWAVAAWRSGQRSARFYAIALGGLCFGLLLNRLALDQVVPHTAFTEWILEVGITWEAIVLAFAVADHVRNTVQENALLQASGARLQQLATIDGLTGIANRRAFDQRLELEWNRALRAGDPIGLLFVDVDFFKQYNDSCGHVAGDDCLRRVAQTMLRVAARATDLCARYGGEEFAILLPEAGPDEAARRAEALRLAIADLAISHPASPERRVTISIGVASVSPGAERSPRDLIDAADRALYEAKNGGRNAVMSAAPQPARTA
jgi:diguanylate cyclase (GGDEF)-like protein